MHSKILVVEDDPDIGRLIARILGEAGYLVSVATSGTDAEAKAHESSPDLVIVDLMLPDTDGLTLVGNFKARYGCGIIIVSGRGEPVERIVGLEIGADDYVTKPFEPRELVARVRSVLRRTVPSTAPINASSNDQGIGGGSPSGPSIAASPVFEFDGWRLDTGSRTLSNACQPVPLTTGEYQLLTVLLERAGRVLTRDQLLDLTHGTQTPAFDRSVDVQIGRIRTKIEADRGQPQIIKTVRNGGYMLAVPVRRL